MSNNILPTIIQECVYITTIYGSKPQIIENCIMITKNLNWYKSPKWRNRLVLPDYIETVLITSAATIYISNEQQLK